MMPASAIPSHTPSTPVHSTTPRRRKGVTLVEAIISLLILGIVLGVGYVMLNRTFLSLERQRQSLDTLHEARYFLALIERDLRQMTRLVALDTVFKDNLFHDHNALLYSMTLEIPTRDGKGLMTVTYTYDGPDNHADSATREKVVYRQEQGGVKRALVTNQLDYLKIWGTDGTIFRNRSPEEALDAYRSYLRPHYYSPNSAGAGLRDLAKVRGIEVQLSMHEIFDSGKKPIKQRVFVTRIYPRVLNSKFE
jgi:type II secretory pathway component PulJ